MSSPTEEQAELDRLAARKRARDQEEAEDAARIADAEARRVLRERAEQREIEDRARDEQRQREDAALEQARRQAIADGKKRTPSAFASLPGSSSSARTTRRTSVLPGSPTVISRTTSLDSRRPAGGVAMELDAPVAPMDTDARSSRKRGAESTASEASHSTSGGTKRARRTEALAPGKTCNRCLQKNITCIPPPPGTMRKSCEACSKVRQQCVDAGDSATFQRRMSEAGSDSAWQAREDRVELDEPAEGGSRRVYGPVTSADDQVGTAESRLMGRWLDASARINLQIADVIHRLGVEIRGVHVTAVQAAEATLLNALVNFRGNAVDRRADRDGWYEAVRRDYMQITGVDVGPDDPLEDEESSAAPTAEGGADADEDEDEDDGEESDEKVVVHTTGRGKRGAR